MKTKIRAVPTLMVIVVVVALATGSIPAQAQTVTATVAAGTNPFAVAFFYGGNSSRQEIPQTAPRDLKSEVTCEI